MPRKPNTASAYYNDAFPTALRKLMSDGKITQDELAENINVSRQMVSQYCSGASAPPLTTVAKIANYFNVSTDYLLGLTDFPTIDADELSACKYTGLSEKAMAAIKDYGDAFDLNIFLTMPEFWNLIDCLRNVGSEIVRLRAKMDNTKIHYFQEPELAARSRYLDATEALPALIDAFCGYHKVLRSVDKLKKQNSGLKQITDIDQLFENREGLSND